MYGFCDDDELLLLSQHCAYSAAQVFHSTPLCAAFVNLKPLLPGHVLVIPRRVVPRITDLSAEEATDFILTVQRVGRTVERVYGATAMNIAMQDGPDAGQSVPHVHMHIIPRKKQDMENRGGNDAIYGLLEGVDGDVGRHLRERYAAGNIEKGEEAYASRPTMPPFDEAARKPRSDAEMAQEAQMLAKEMKSDATRL